ncbi:hypothetical protein SAMN06265222_1316 [Neorhodopirellula lusitana]|uniref:Uncharacterized protein n=1 Tax=Neorhodopirellula lusitana TaxID=445327 RepID=A0ABY1QUT4_9BACT|nr:hypothetical protein SAMN06265222_1316 [Neorhodopirellula lusitana]
MENPLSWTTTVLRSITRILMKCPLWMRWTFAVGFILTLCFAALFLYSVLNFKAPIPD